MKFCTVRNLSILKSLNAGFQSALYSLFICFNRIQCVPVKIRQLQLRRQVILLICLLTPLAFSLWPLASAANAAAVTLAWDASQEENIAGYRIYYGTTSGHYSSMIDAGNNTSGSITNLVPGETYYIAATAYDTSGSESGFSQEIPYTVPIIDSDGDGVADEMDAFPLDPAESADNDGDGIGNNADLDDDNDGMPDAWEIVNNLNPLANDAGGDPDGDGVSNFEEYRAGTGPFTYEDKSPPEAPVLLMPVNNEIVSLTPELTTDGFYDADAGDVHAESRWRIFRVSDNLCVLDVTSNSALTSLQVPKLVLEEDTGYIWEVQFINNHGAQSDWSGADTFTTDMADQDFNGNGIPDHQEVDASVDLDADGTPDIDQDDIRCVNVEDGTAQICVSMRDAETVHSITAIESQNPQYLDEGRAANSMPESMLFGLLNYKLVVDFPGDEAVVTIYLSEPAPPDAVWYKYDPVNKDWFDYSDFTEFSADRKAIYLTVIDGGFGDADGIDNGIIIDPIGLGTPPASTSSSGSDSSAACFISTAGHRSAAIQPVDILKRMRGIELAMMFLLPLLFICLRKIANRR